MIMAPHAASSSQDHVQEKRTPKKVKVVAAVESLCIGCKGFMNEQLFPTFQLLGSRVMDLHVVVYGNSLIDWKAKQVTCQHGPAECDANTYEQCAIDLYPYPERYLGYLLCLDNSLEMGFRKEPFPSSIFAECARQQALDFESIKACHDDDQRAWQLQKQAAARTPANHTYVPWIEINGVHAMDEDNDTLLDVVCKAYKQSGGSHPACHVGGFDDIVRTVAKA